MFKVASALLLAAVSIAPANAATSIIFTPGDSNVPGYIAQPYSFTQNFTTANDNGTAYLADLGKGEMTTGDVRTFQNSVDGQAVGPNVDPATGSFLSIGGPGAGSYSINFGATGVQVFSFVFGGLDNYNSVTLNFLGGGSELRTGGQILGGGVNDFLGSTGRVTYDFGGMASLIGVTFASTQAAFEIDSVVAAVPEPATWLLMILGFGLVGSQLRRRKVQAKINFATV